MDIDVPANYAGNVVDATGNRLYGLDAETYLKIESKRDPELERQLLDWVLEVTGDTFEFPGDPLESLKSGIILCHLAEKLWPYSINKIHTRKVGLLEMENLQSYLGACWKAGIPSEELFVVSDLYRRKGVPQFFLNLQSVARHAASLTKYSKSESGDKKGVGALGAKMAGKRTTKWTGAITQRKQLVIEDIEADAQRNKQLKLEREVRSKTLADGGSHSEAALRTEVELLRTQLVEARQEQTRLKQKERENAQVNAVAAVDASSEEGVMEAIQKRLKEAEANLRAVESAKDTLQRQYNESERQLSDSKQQISDLEKKFAAAQAVPAAAEKESASESELTIKKLQKEASFWKEKVTEKSRLVLRGEKALQEAQAEITRLNGIVTTLREEKDDMSVVVLRAQGEERRLKAVRVTLESQQKDAEERAKNAEAESLASATKVEAISRELKDARAEIDDLQLKMDSLLDELEAARERVRKEYELGSDHDAAEGMEDKSNEITSEEEQSNAASEDAKEEESASSDQDDEDKLETQEEISETVEIHTEFVAPVARPSDGKQVIVSAHAELTTGSAAAPSSPAPEPAWKYASVDSKHIRGSPRLSALMGHPAMQSIRVSTGGNADRLLATSVGSSGAGMLSNATGSNGPSCVTQPWMRLMNSCLTRVFFAPNTVSVSDFSSFQSEALHTELGRRQLVSTLQLLSANIPGGALDANAFELLLWLMLRVFTLYEVGEAARDYRTLFMIVQLASRMYRFTVVGAEFLADFLGGFASVVNDSSLWEEGYISTMAARRAERAAWLEDDDDEAEESSDSSKSSSSESAPVPAELGSRGGKKVRGATLTTASSGLANSVGVKATASTVGKSTPDLKTSKAMDSKLEADVFARGVLVSYLSTMARWSCSESVIRHFLDSMLESNDMSNEKEGLNNELRTIIAAREERQQRNQVRDMGLTSTSPHSSSAHGSGLTLSKNARGASMPALPTGKASSSTMALIGSSSGNHSSNASSSNASKSASSSDKGNSTRSSSNRHAPASRKK